MTAAILPASSDHKRSPRGRVVGWSQSAARRNIAFLRTVDERRLDGLGLFITLTVRECPISPQVWSAMVKAWIRRQERAGMIRLHWVLEFQRRGVPHLHAAIFYEDRTDHSLSGQVDPDAPGFWENIKQSDAIDDWLEIAEPYDAREFGQDVRVLDVDGHTWASYQAKHSSRGRGHYQRQRANLPQAWETTGRVWGKWGDWPTFEPEKITIEGPEFHRLRRIIKRRRISQARTDLARHRADQTTVFADDHDVHDKQIRRRITRSRRWLQHPDPRNSSRIALSEWTPSEISDDLVAAACS